MADLYGWYGADTQQSRLEGLADDGVIFHGQTIALHAAAGLN